MPTYPVAGGYAEHVPPVRLASNESPEPPLAAVREAIGRALSTLNRYPDPSNSLLRERLSERYGVPAARIAIGKGVPLVSIAGIVQKAPDAVIALKGTGILKPKDIEGKRWAFIPDDSGARIFPAFAAAAPKMPLPLAIAHGKLLSRDPNNGNLNPRRPVLAAGLG